MENKKPKHQTPYIPEWFLLEILLRLPSKSVFRFNCLSKQVLTLISDPSFVRYYISRVSSKPLPWTLITLRMLPAHQAHLQPYGENFEQIFSDPSHLESAPSTSKLVTPFPSMENTQVVAISNGLCLCTCWDMKQSYFIFSPVTKQFDILPPWTRLPNDSVMAFYARVDQLGHVSYKLAHLPMDRSRPTTRLTVEEFSSQTYKWTSFTALFPHPISSAYLKKPFSFKGILHWVDYYEHFGPYSIISYDPARIIPCPGSEWLRWCGEIVSAGGEHTIRCIRQDFDQTFYLWRLKDYEQEIWLLEHKFHINEIQFPYAENKMMTCSELIKIVLHPLEPDLLYVWGRQGVGREEWMPASFVSFNVRSRKSKVNQMITKESASVEIPCLYKTPFVLPPWPAILPHRSLSHK